MRASDASKNGGLAGLEHGFNPLISPKNSCPPEDGGQRGGRMRAPTVSRPPGSCAGPSKTPVRRGIRGFDKATNTHDDKATIPASNAAHAISAADADPWVTIGKA